MTKKAKAILIVILCVLVCAAVVMGVVSYQRDRAASTSREASNTYLRILTFSQLVTYDHRASSILEMDETYYDNLSDLVDYFNLLDTQMNELPDMAELEEQFPTAVSFLRGMCEYMSGLDGDDTDTFDFESYSECDQILQSGRPGTNNHHLDNVLENLEEYIPEYFPDAMESLQKLIEA